MPLAEAESVSLKQQAGTFLVPVLINDHITLNFTIDSGAADVVIPEDVFSTLIRTGTVSPQDLLDAQVYELADGSKQTSQRFKVRLLRIGNIELKDVIASVAPQAGSLLLGQSFLSRINSWSIDNERHLLLLDEQRPKLASDDHAVVLAASPSSYEVQLKAVQFALIGDQGGEAEVQVLNMKSCDFRIVRYPLPNLGGSVTEEVFHLNNVDPSRTTIEKFVDFTSAANGDVTFTLFGEQVVAEVYNRWTQMDKTDGRSWQQYRQISRTIPTRDYQRTIRAWEYIYTHGCTGSRSSF
jgi:clan AA aspartic protease (TIGR02281 family)